MNFPNDPVMLLSFVNTQLRDFYPSLQELAQSAGIAEEDITKKLAIIGYTYDSQLNKFV